ncbi:MAG: hypothetical protein ACOCXP_00745 [Candidatus Dojkabacteria bacterium]
MAANKTAQQPTAGHAQLKDIEVEFSEVKSWLKKVAQNAKSLSEIEESYNEKLSELLSPKGKLQEILKGLKDIKEPEVKKKLGKGANELKQKIEKELKEEQERSKRDYISLQEKDEYLSPTHPGLPYKNNSQLVVPHILEETITKIEEIFAKMGFEAEYAYEIDNEEHTFDHLNIPEDHPARDGWDTLWLEDGNLAVPHTSSMQNRILSEELDLARETIRKVILGKTFRNEATDATHEHTFTQCEGVYLSKNATMSEMIGTLIAFFEAFYETKLDYKFTPDFFPFVEPGGQLAIRFPNKKSEDKTATELKSQFLEVLGCGMIHPKVLKAAGKDPAVYSGFAWGFGVERIIMIKHGISEIRYFHSNNLEFINQFSSKK